MTIISTFAFLLIKLTSVAHAEDFVFNLGVCPIPQEEAAETICAAPELKSIFSGTIALDFSHAVGRVKEKIIKKVGETTTGGEIESVRDTLGYFSIRIPLDEGDRLVLTVFGATEPEKVARLVKINRDTDKKSGTNRPQEEIDTMVYHLLHNSIMAQAQDESGKRLFGSWFFVDLKSRFFIELSGRTGKKDHFYFITMNRTPKKSKD